jgi:phosphatidylglycerol:prolipoprotein diacylglycerol transferase
MIYATTRFLIEFLRGDEPGQLGTGLTISQLISLGMFLTGLVVILDRSVRPVYRQIAAG